MAEETVPTVAPAQEELDVSEDMIEDDIGVEKDLSGDGGCKKTILKLGEGWEKPEKGDEVTVHYVGTLLDGTKFDSSRDRGEPFKFTLGMKQVIQGWDTGVATMKKGEKANLVCRSDYAYGAAGSPPTIPPDATLQFEVELLSWKSVKDITGDGGVIKTVVSEGQGWQNPKDDDEVVVTYTARLRLAAAGTKSDATEQQQQQEGPVVAQSPEGGAVFDIRDAPCSGFAVVLKNMKPNEKVQLLLKPEYAAGLADVPADHVLDVELHLTELHKVDHPAPGVVKKQLNDPDGWTKPNDGSTVTIVVTTKSVDGATVYEAEKEVTFTTDEEQVPEGLELAVAAMKADEHALVTVTDPTLLKAPAGAVAGADVPADAAAVVYDVVLKNIVKAKDKWELNNQEKLALALARKEKGNAAYKAGNLVRAARQYKAAVETATSINERDFAPGTDDGSSSSSASVGSLMSQAKEVKKACMNNWAAVELKRGNYAEAAAQATKVLELDPSNMKAIYRTACARMELGDLVEAEVACKSGLLSEPDNKDLQALQRKLKVRMRELNKKEAKLYGKMFAALGKGAAATPEAAAADGAADTQAPMEADQDQAPPAADAAPTVVEAAA